MHSSKSSVAHPPARPDWRRVALGVLAVLLVLELLVVLIGPSRIVDRLPFLRPLPPRPVPLAYFYKPPVDGTGPDVVARAAGLIVLTRGDEPFRDQVRAAGYQGLILQYLMANEIDGPAPPPAACDTSYKPWQNNAGSEVGDYCSLPESAFLHNG